MTREDIIEKARQIHGDDYLYDKVEDNLKMMDNVTIVCPLHGEFRPRLNRFLRGSKCKYCVGKIKKTVEQFEIDARKVHGDKYDYSNFVYVDSHTPSIITCPMHGDFLQNATNHLNGNGCPKCKNELLKEIFSSNIDEFILKARVVHGYKYDYSESVYVNNRTPMKIICPNHGEFWQTPQGHLSGRGCPICNESHLEREVRLCLDEKGIEYTRQERFDFLGYQSVDFYLPKHNLAIECQGKQHFGIEGWKMDKELQDERDIKKAELLKEHKIGLVYYTNVEKEIALCNETRLYKEGNTHFDLEFLDALE